MLRSENDVKMILERYQDVKKSKTNEKAQKTYDGEHHQSDVIVEKIGKFVKMGAKRA